MLTQLLLAARYEGIPPLVYVRFLIRLGLANAATRLKHLDPDLATQFLDTRYEQANRTDRFLLSCWGTLAARLRPLLTETVVRCFLRCDFSAEDIMRSDKPVIVYLRWKEQDLLALSPLIRLLWGTLIHESTTTYDSVQGKGCHPVLLLIDEAGRTAIPMLADQATTVVGRGISMWIAIQSLVQLEAVYGRARAQVLRDNMETQLYYRPADQQTAKYLEDRLGSRSGFAHSTTLRDGEETSVGETERPIPLLASQEITQLTDEEIIRFHQHLPPFRLTWMDWRKHPVLRQRRNIPAPQLSALPQLEDGALSTIHSETVFVPHDYIDPDMLHGSMVD